MVDRVKYFMLGLLFLVVAAVIAYDRWNSEPEPLQSPGQAREEDDRRVTADVSGGDAPRIDPGPLKLQPKPDERAPGPEPEAKEKGNSLELPPLEPLKKETAPPAPVEKRPAAERKPEAGKKRPTASQRVHVVRSGESLEKIAMRYYRTRRGVAWIVDANGLKDRNRIYVNQKLIIPARKDAGKTVVPTVRKAKTKIPSRYRVKKGDGDLYAICKRFYGAKGQGALVARIMEENHLWSADVTPGTVIILPPK